MVLLPELERRKKKKRGTLGGKNAQKRTNLEAKGRTSGFTQFVVVVVLRKENRERLTREEVKQGNQGNKMRKKKKKRTSEDGKKAEGNRKKKGR